MSRDTTTKMINRFIKRDVTYLLGENNTGDIEQSCSAKLQGPHRRARDKNFKDLVDLEYPKSNNSVIIVPNIGHTQYGMYKSE
jgi:hypothetical protein